MNKPKAETYFCYQACIRYLHQKHQIKIGDEFLRWIVDHNDGGKNSLFSFERQDLDDNNLDANEQVKTIYKLFLDEFADENGQVTVHIWW